MYVSFQGFEVCLKLRSSVAGESGVGSVACGEVVADDNKLVSAPAVGLVVGCADINLAAFWNFAVMAELSEVITVEPIIIVIELRHDERDFVICYLPKVGRSETICTYNSCRRNIDRSHGAFDIFPFLFLVG